MNRVHGLQVMLCVVVVACAQCGKSPDDAPPPAAAQSPGQPAGLRTASLRCDVDTPAGLSRSPSPMPDHIAEFMSPGMPPATTVIVGERGETDLDSARKQLLDYYRSGLLTSEGARVIDDGLLSGAQVPGRLMTMRWGPKSKGRLETVALLAFPGPRIVEVVASHTEGDDKAGEAVMALVRSLKCK